MKWDEWFKLVWLGIPVPFKSLPFVLKGKVYFGPFFFDWRSRAFDLIASVSFEKKIVYSLSLRVPKSKFP